MVLFATLQDATSPSSVMPPNRTMEPHLREVSVRPWTEWTSQTYMDDELVEADDDDPKFQSVLTGAGAGPPSVAMETSPMMRSASLQAWYWRSISSRLTASSALSSIIDCCRGAKIEIKDRFRQTIIPLDRCSQISTAALQRSKRTDQESQV